MALSIAATSVVLFAVALCSVMYLAMYPAADRVAIHTHLWNEFAPSQPQPIRKPMIPPFYPSRTTVACTESVPLYRDPERDVFEVPDHLRHTCLFRNLYYDLDRRQLLFVVEDANDTMDALPPMSIMGFPNARSAPMLFPIATITEVRRSDLLSGNGTALRSFAPILGIIARTYETHHGHTLFDGVFSHWLALRRAGVAPAEISARDMLLQFYDAKGIAPMDDRFTLLSALPLLRGDRDAFRELADLPPMHFAPLHGWPDNSTAGRNVVMVERMIAGLAGFGWASAPQTQEWRGQRMREFRAHALAKLGVAPGPPIGHDNVDILVIDRVPSQRLANGRSVNYFARWIFDEGAAWARLAADTNATIRHVTFEEATLPAQMSIVQHASIIITLEGCAMENVLFFRDHTTLVALQYNRRWEHYYYPSARHFVEYAQFVHVAMVATRIDDAAVPIQNTGGNFGVHLHYDLLLAAVRDAIARQTASPLPACDGLSRCGSLVYYTADNGTYALL